MGWGELIDGAADLLIGGRCAACGRPGRSCCPGCIDRLRRLTPVVQAVPGCAEVALVSGGPYAAELKALLIAAKERGGLMLMPVLADRLAVAVLALLVAQRCTTVVLVPVPSVPARVAERGHDVTHALAKAVAKLLRKAGAEVGVARCLHQVRRPADQAGLGASARQQNLAGAFAATQLPNGSALIVIDDIVTTGASLAEAVRALRAVGRVPIGAATVAATPLRGRSKR